MLFRSLELALIRCVQKLRRWWRVTLLLVLRGHRRWHALSSLLDIWVGRLSLAAIRGAIWVFPSWRLVLVIASQRVVCVVVGHSVCEAFLTVDRYLQL